MNAPLQAWEQTGVFPVRPTAGTYGYAVGGKLCACSREELIERCSASRWSRAVATLAWTPETPRLVPITEVPLLADAVESHISASMRQSVLYMFLGLFLALGAWGAGAGIDALPIAFFVLPAAHSLADSIADRRAVQRRRQGLEQWAPDAAQRFGYWLGTRRAVFPWVAAAGLALVAVCQLVGGPARSVEAAGLVKTAVRQGQRWRLLTGPMLHGGLWHLMGNLGALLALGHAVEALAGWGRLAVVLLVSLSCGSLLSVYLLPHTNSIGASGGIMGLLGFLIVLGFRYKKVLPAAFVRSLVKGVVWVAVAGLVGYAFIDNAAHAGGFLAGLGLGQLLVPPDDRLPLGEPTIIRATGLTAAGVLLLAAFVSAVLVVRS